MLCVTDSSHAQHSCYILPKGCQLEALLPPREHLLHPDSQLGDQPGGSCGPRKEQIAAGCPC